VRPLGPRSTRYARTLLLVALGTGAALIPAACGHVERAQANLQLRDRHAVIVDLKTGEVDAGFRDLPGVPEAAVDDGEGGWFIADSAKAHIVRLEADGRVDATFKSDISCAPLVRLGDVLYCSSEGVLAFDRRSGKRFWLKRAKSERWPGQVHSLATGKRALYVSGYFSEIGGVRRNGLAALDPRTGRALSWAPPRIVDRNSDPPFQPNINSLSVYRGRVFVDGLFTQVGKANRLAGPPGTTDGVVGLAAFDARTGKLLPWRPVADAPASNSDYSIGYIGQILATHGQVLVGDDGSTFGVFDARTGAKFDWRKVVSGGVNAFAIAGDVVYLGGSTVTMGGITSSSFDAIGGKPANNLAAVHLPDGKPLDWRPNLANFVDATVLSVSGDKLLVGGWFRRTPTGPQS
jgi:hypothetical protein